MERSNKRTGESSSDDRQAKRTLRSQNVEARPASETLAPAAHAPAAQLPELQPFDIISDLTCLLPSQVFEASTAFSKEKYTRDIWHVFSEQALIDNKLAEMHQVWFECRRPDSQLLWEARYPPKGAELHGYKPRRTQVLRTVLTLQLIMGRVSQEQFPELYRSFAGLQLDYIMLMCVMCLRSTYLSEMRQYFPDYEEQFERIAQLLGRAPSKGEHAPPSDQEAALATIPAEFGTMATGLLVNPSAVKNLNQVAGCEAAKSAFEAAAYIYRKRPHLIKEGYGSKNILLHGSPGTGKSTLATTLAAESAMPCYNVNASHLVDKWLGASEKNVRFLFEIANSHGPSVIIFDEVDAICSVRKSSSNDGSQRMT